MTRQDESKRFEKLLVAALTHEWSHLKQSYPFVPQKSFPGLYCLKDRPKVGLLQIGMGAKRAKERFKSFLGHFTCDSVLHFGYAGALTDTLKTGDVFLAGGFFSNNHRISCDSRRRVLLAEHLNQAGVKFSQGSLYSSKAVLKNKEEKLSVQKIHPVDCVDMESFGVAQLCTENKIDYLSVRVIFDEVGDDLQNFPHIVDAEGRIDGLGLMADLMKNPKAIVTLGSLKKRSAMLNQKLQQVVEGYLQLESVMTP